MKSSSKLSIAFVFSISLLFLSCSLLLWNAEADVSLQKVSLGNDAVRIQTDQATPVPVVDVQLLENTDQCLADCYAILKFHPYQDIVLPPQADSEFAWNFEKEKPWMDGLVSHHFELLETTEYKVDMPEYGKTSSTRHAITRITRLTSARSSRPSRQARIRRRDTGTNTSRSPSGAKPSKQTRITP